MSLHMFNHFTSNFYAIALNIQQVQYSRYETGVRIMPVTLLIKLARYYDVSLEYLTGISNIKNSYPKDKVESK